MKTLRDRFHAKERLDQDEFLALTDELTRAVRAAGLTMPTLSGDDLIANVEALDTVLSGRAPTVPSPMPAPAAAIPASTDPAGAPVAGSVRVVGTGRDAVRIQSFGPGMVQPVEGRRVPETADRNALLAAYEKAKKEGPVALAHFLEDNERAVARLLAAA